MKKKLSLLLALLITASFAGCSGGNENSSGTSVEPTVTSQISEISENESSDVSEESQQSSEQTSEQAESSVVSQSSVNDESSKDESSKEAVSETPQASNESSKEISVEETTSAEPSKTEPSKTEPSNNNQPSVQSSSEAPKPEQPSKAESSVVSQVSETIKPTPEPVKPDTPVSDNDIGGMELYEQLFNMQNAVTVDISMDKSEIDKLQADYQKYTARDENKKSEIYRKANVTIKVGSKSYTIDEVGIRLKGNQSLEPFYAPNGTPNICSFKLSFDETFDDKDEYGSNAKVWTDDNARKARKKRTVATLNELDMKWNICYDNTNIREIYATKLFESANVLVQKIG
ncbi:MAG: hypothetical protein IIT39_16020, partial [Clostridia bacterium]|nr:hypothetical protein [Clostridia bacterium]